MAEFKNTRRNIGRATASARREAEEVLEDGMDTASEYIDEMKGRAGEVWEGAKRKAKKGAAQTQEYAEDHPWHMAAIGAVAGFLLAALVIRRRD